jgi:hypothetical protein
MSDDAIVNKYGEFDEMKIVRSNDRQILKIMLSQ